MKAILFLACSLFFSSPPVFAEEQSFRPWGQQGYSSNCSEIPSGRFVARGPEEKKKLQPWLGELVKQIRAPANESLNKIANESQIEAELKIKDDGFYDVIVRKSTASAADQKLFVEALTKAAPIKYAPPYRSAFLYPLLVTYKNGNLSASFGEELFGKH